MSDGPAIETRGLSKDYGRGRLVDLGHLAVLVGATLVLTAGGAIAVQRRDLR